MRIAIAVLSFGLLLALVAVCVAALRFLVTVAAAAVLTLALLYVLRGEDLP